MFIRMINAKLQDLFAKSSMGDDLIADAIRMIKEGGTPPMKSSVSDWKIKEGLLFFRDRCYVPQNIKLRQEITKQYHESLSTSHPRQFQTLELIRRDYWWPGMSIFVKNYIAGCATCQQMTVNTHPTLPPILPIKSTTM